MAPALLLVGHGSKDMEGNVDFLKMVERARPRFPGRLLKGAFIEFCAPEVPEGLDLLVAEGARDVTVIPVILFAAGHAKMDIPGSLDAARRRHPGVSFRYGAPIGVQSGLFNVLRAKAGSVERERGWGPDRSETVVLLIGRGSSDPDANADLHKIARYLWEGSGWKDVQVCFSGTTSPRFEEGIRRCAALGAKRVVMIPYFLFTGILLKRLQSQSEAWRPKFPGLDWGFAPELGHEDELLDIVAARVAEAEAGEVRMSCDLCKIRIDAAGQRHTHGH